MTASKIPLNFFGIPFGLAGLGEVWTTLAGYHYAPDTVAVSLVVVAAVAWVAVLGAYLRYLVARPSELVRDLLDPVAAPFAALVLITPMLLSSVGLYPHAETAGRVLVDVFLTATVLLGGWFTGQWIYGSVELDKFHPGYFLPTVAGGLIGSAAAAAVGQQRLAEVMFGLGMMSWIVVGSLVLGRLFFRPMLLPALQPTLAIEVAPAAVASLAWFQIHGAEIDFLTAFLAGYGVLMVLAQVRLMAAYRRLPFMPSTWAFTFSWAAVATVTLVWLQDSRVAGFRTWQYLVVAAITILIVGIGLRTLLAISRHQLLTRPGTAPAAAAPAPASATVQTGAARVSARPPAGRATSAG